MGSEYFLNPNRQENILLRLMINELLRSIKSDLLILKNEPMQLENEPMRLKSKSMRLERMDRTESLPPRGTTGANMKRTRLSVSQKAEPRNAPTLDNWIKKDEDEENFDLHQINQFVAWSELPDTDFQDLEYEYLFEKLKQTLPHVLLEERLRWEARADSQGPIIQKITEKITQIEQQARASGIEKMKATDEMKPRLLEIGEEIEKLYEKRKENKASIKVINLGEVLLKKVHCVMKDFIKKFFALENNEVVVSYFQKEIEKPEDLEPIASRIKQERGRDTEFELLNIETLVCAVIKQMEEVPAEELNLDMFLRWDAVLNKAKHLGFRVKFAEVQLKKNVYDYFSHYQFARD